MKGRALLLAIGVLAGMLQVAEGAETWQRIPVDSECSQQGAASTCLLRLPERKMRDLIVDVPAGDQLIGFHLYVGSLGSWQLEASGFWHAAPESRHRIWTVKPLHGGPVRLELFGEARPPRLAGVTVAAGEPEPSPANELGPAPESSRAVFALENAWFPAAWPLQAAGARPGDTVRLELPAEVLARLGRYERSGLRVATPEGQLPLTFEIEDLPRAQVEMAEARWIPAERPGWLRLSLPDLPEGLSYTEAQLFAPPQPLARRVLVEGEERLWSCMPEPPLPCRLALGFYINRWPPRRLPEIEIEGGEGNPLPPLRVSVWRQTEYLVFVWPAQGPVRLLAGNDRVSGSSTISLLEIDPRADDRPWKRAVLGPEERLPLFRRWHRGGAAFATLVLVGLCLKERRRRRLVAALLLSLCAAQTRGEDVFLEQPLEVPAAGWVRVPLDVETLSLLGPERRWLQVLGPDGTELPAGVWLPAELPLDANGRLPDVDLAPASLIFEAVEPGAYRLVLGQGQGPDEGYRPLPWNARLSTLQPRPARKRPLPPLPVEAVAPRGTLGGFQIAEEWPVRAPGAAAGGVVRLELPAEAHLRAGSLDRLRLETAGRQIPYVLERRKLVFVWPGEGAVRLLAGAEGGAAPTYDLHAIANQLLARSWKPAVLGPGVEHSAPGSQKTRKALLGAAALVLLAGVHRLMPRSSPPAGLH